ncbi:MAG: hypothetical protein ACRYGI_01630 [Janthinobacterium lividum]
MANNRREHQDATGRFSLRRFIPIYPTWWIALSVSIGIRLVVPDSLHNANVDFSSILCSHLLLPHYHAVFTEYVWPIPVPGWTSETEILFYSLFAGTLFVSFLRTRLIAIMLVLADLSLIGMIVPQNSATFENLTNPLLIEFAGGVFVASQTGLGFSWVRRRKCRISAHSVSAPRQC